MTGTSNPVSRRDSERNPAHSPPDVAGSRLIMCEQASERREELECFIHVTASHGAQVRSFLPALLALQDAGQIRSVAGFGPAAHEALFLERYLIGPRGSAGSADARAAARCYRQLAADCACRDR